MKLIKSFGNVWGWDGFYRIEEPTWYRPLQGNLLLLEKHTVMALRGTKLVLMLT